jgi:hypothetical protein
MAELRRATGELGIVVVNVTQCSQGSVSKIYSGGFALERAGVVAGGGQFPASLCHVADIEPDHPRVSSVPDMTTEVRPISL